MTGQAGARLYRSSDVYKLTGATKPQLDAMIRRGLVKPQRTVIGGWARYTDRDVEQIKHFVALRAGVCPHCGGPL